MNSIKKNFFFSTFLTISNYVFPLITYPYVSRVLQVERIGLCNFVDSIINYFILFSMLGISTYGIREIAKNKSDKTKLNQTFYDLISINILMSILLCFILFISLNYSETLSQNKQLVYIGICKLLLNTFLVEWFYKGIENFKYITIRSFIVKCLYCHICACKRTKGLLYILCNNCWYGCGKCILQYFLFEEFYFLKIDTLQFIALL